MDTNDLFTAAFWRATIQRVLRSFAASLGGLLTADGTGILNARWTDQLSAAGMAALITLLLCVAGGTVTKGAGPAWGAAEVTSPPAPPVDNPPPGRHERAEYPDQAQDDGV
jgi:hypothetical protein